jgi:hypothetical protein
MSARHAAPDRGTGVPRANQETLVPSLGSAPMVALKSFSFAERARPKSIPAFPGIPGGTVLSAAV